jgi:2-C-methyl-D-erythritol 4-phosphate cytidylyltransferase
VGDEDIEAVFSMARKTGAAILATPVTSTLKLARQGQIVETLPRTNKWLGQTPQVFRRTDLINAFKNRGSFQPTDEAELIERAGIPVSLVEGSSLNLKITTKDDLRLARAILKSAPAPKLDAPAHPFADGDLWR